MQLRSGRIYGGRGRGIGLQGRIRKGKRFGVRPMLRRKGLPLHPRPLKRRRSGYSQPSKRMRIYRDPNQYRQLETVMYKHGRKDKRATFMSKLVTSSYNFTKYLFRSYNRDGDGGAADGGLRQPLGQERVTDDVFMPVLIFDLTELPQATASSARSAAAGWRLRQNVVNGVVGFQELSGLAGDGSSPGNGFIEYVNQGSSGNVGNTSSTRRALMEWVNIRFRIRGPTQRATRVTVQLVQPYAWFTGMPQEFQLTSGAVANEIHQEWINIAARNTASPVQSIPSAIKRPWKVLRTKTYELQPTSTTESDATGHDIVQKWFWRCNKGLAYDHAGWFNLDNSDATDLNLGDGTTPDTAVKNYLALGKRVYLIVQAYAPNVSASFNAAIHPSFEWYFEKKLSSLTGQVTY